MHACTLVVYMCMLADEYIIIGDIAYSKLVQGLLQCLQTVKVSGISATVDTD